MCLLTAWICSFQEWLSEMTGLTYGMACYWQLHESTYPDMTLPLVHGACGNMLLRKTSLSLTVVLVTTAYYISKIVANSGGEWTSVNLDL